MSRLPLLTYDATDPEQRELWDQIVASRGKGLSLIDAQGGMVGPFGAFVRRPHLGEHLIKVGGAVRFASSLEPRLLELAITTVGARWKAEFEFWAHSALALSAGVDRSIIDALATGDEPVFSDEVEQIVYRYTMTLAETGRVGQGLYDDAVDALGVDRVVDLTHTIGYYTHICFVLNAFEVPLPPDTAPIWG